MIFLKNIPNKYTLLAIVALGFVLRANNLTIGFPQLFVSNDEAIYHQSALNMLAQKTPFSIGNYGPLGAYVQIPFLLIAFGVLLLTGKVHSVADMEFLLVTQEGYMLFIPRVISAMFGTLSILVTYKLARELFGNKRIALWASFFAAVSFDLVHISHLARAWSPAIFFSLLAILFVVKSIKSTKNEQINSMLAFSFSAISFGFHQISGVIIILVLMIRIFGGKGFKRILAKPNLFGAACWFLLVLLFNSLSLGGNFFKIIEPNNPGVGLVHWPTNARNLRDILEFFITNDYLLKVVKDVILTDGLVAFFALLFLVSKGGRFHVRLPFAIFFIFNFLLIVTVFPPFLRYFLISIALLPVFAAYTVNRLSSIRKYALLFGLLVIIIASFNSLYWNLLILREPSFNQMRKWVDKNIRPEIPIAATQVRNVGYVPNSIASEPIRRTKPGYYARAANIVGESYPYNVRNIIYADQFKTGSKISDLGKVTSIYPVTYVIDPYSGLADRLISQESNVKLELVAHFSPSDGVIYESYIPEALFDAPTNFPLFRVDRGGPYFDVLRVK